jgi:hypothetical protein
MTKRTRRREDRIARPSASGSSEGKADFNFLSIPKPSGQRVVFRVAEDTPGIVLPAGNRPRSDGCLALSTGCAFIGSSAALRGYTNIALPRPRTRRGSIAIVIAIVDIWAGRT